MKGVATGSQHATYEERLRLRILRCGPDAVEAAVALMERHDPASFEDALEFIPSSADLSPRCQKALMEAWDRYFHISGMSWD
jgi:hypothetical protein